MTTVLQVATPTATYPFTIGENLLQRIGATILELKPAVRSVLLVTDHHVNALGYADKVLKSCVDAGLKADLVVVEPGDGSKSLATTEILYERCAQAELRRSDLIVALGGGVVGDLAGFVAATYLRGISYVQVPTTLLAHDSSIGGKVGVNTAFGKNLVGAFHHPAAILYDMDTLASLPDREWRGGMAEMIKHGLIGDPELFSALESQPCSVFPGADVAESLIARASQVKIDVVSADEHESGARMVLNLGHTIGHAVEHVSHYQLNHGEAVSIGLRVETEMSAARRLVSAEERERIIRLLLAHGLPVQAPPFPIHDVLSVLAHDKKHSHEGWTFALPKGIGHVALVRGITAPEVVSAWQRMEERES